MEKDDYMPPAGVYHKSLPKSTKIFAYICNTLMIKRGLVALFLIAFAACGLQGCIFHKNKCDTCPSFNKRKK